MSACSSDFDRLLNSPIYGSKKKMGNIYSGKMRVKISHEAPEHKGRLGFIMRFNNDDTAVVDIIHGFSMKRVENLSLDHIDFMQTPLQKLKRLYYVLRNSCNDLF